MSLANAVTDPIAPEFFLGTPPVSVLVNDNMQSVVTRPGEEEYKLSQGLARGFFDAGNGLTLAYYYTTETNIDNATVTSVGYSGFKSDLALNPREIGFLTKRNIPTAWLALNNPERGLDFLDDTKRACSKFITDPPDPVKQIIQSRIPTVLSGHSTGAQIIIEQADDLDHYNMLSDTFCGIVAQSPMLETAPFFNFLSPQFQSKVLDWVTAKNPTSLPEEVPLGKIYLLACGMRYNLDEDRIFIRPTFGQIAVIRDNSRRKILEKETPHLLAKGDLPVVFFIGGKDTSADPATSVAFARAIGATIFKDDKAKHAPICEHPRNMSRYIKTLRQMANGTFDPSAHTVQEPSSRSFGFSTRQSITSGLNSAAGFAQRFF